MSNMQWPPRSPAGTDISGGGPFGSFINVQNSNYGPVSAYGSALYGDVTAEFWAYYAPNRSDWTCYFGAWSVNAGSTTPGNIIFMIGATYTIAAVGGKEIYHSGTTRYADGLAQGWHHIALVRSGTAWTCYIDGVGTLFSSVADTNTISMLSSNYEIHNDSTYYAQSGWIAEIRISNMARYTANFTPATAPFDLMSDPHGDTVYSLLHGGQTADTFDATLRSMWRKQGTLALDTAVKKFGSKSIRFDGTSSYVSTRLSPDTDLYGIPWTIDCWVNPAGPMAGSFISVERVSGPIQIGIGMSSAGLVDTGVGYVLGVGTYSGSAWNHLTDGVTTLTPNTWQHLEVGYDGTTGYIFLNGSLVVSGPLPGYAFTWSNQEHNHLLVGRRWDTSSTNPYFNGWLQEVCLTKGICRHNSAFTPPAAPYDPATDTYASNMSFLLHGTSLPTLGASDPVVLIDEVDVYGGNFTTLVLDALAPLYQTAKIWPTSGSVTEVQDGTLTTDRANALYIPDTDDSRTLLQQQLSDGSHNGFIQGICVVQGNPLAGCVLELQRNEDYQLISRTATGADGLYYFHDLQTDVVKGFYSIAARPDPQILNENAQIYKTLDATPYAVTTTGSFHYTGITIDSTVVINGNAAPFTAVLKSGSLPAGASVSVSGRNVSIEGATSIDSDAVFVLTITGSVRGYTADIEFELTENGTDGLHEVDVYDGSLMNFNGAQTLLVSMEFNNISAPQDWSADVSGLPSFTSVSTNPTKSTAQHIVGDSSLALVGTGFLRSSAAFTYPINDMTVEVWVYLTQLKNYNVILGDYNSNSFQLVVNAAGNYYFSNVTGLTLQGTTVLAINHWYHIAFTRDVDNNATMWLNGASDATANLVGPMTSGTTNYLSIGSSTTSTSSFVKGYINRVRVYNDCKYFAPFTPDTIPLRGTNLLVPL